MFRTAALALACAALCAAASINTDYYQVLEDDGSTICDLRLANCGAYSGQISSYFNGVSVIFDPNSPSYRIFLPGGNYQNNYTDKTVRFVYRSCESITGRYAWKGGTGDFTMKFDIFDTSIVPHDDQFVGSGNITTFVRRISTDPFPGLFSEQGAIPFSGTFNVPFNVNIFADFALTVDYAPGEVGGGRFSTSISAIGFDFRQNGQPIDVQLVALPEPSSLLLLAPALLLLYRFRKHSPASRRIKVT